MQTLLIHYDSAFWHAKVANTQVTYEFTDGLASVKKLAAHMRDGEADLLPAISDIFQGNEDPQVVINQLFESTDALIYIDAMIVHAGENISLLSDLESAGEALAAVLA